MYSKDRQKMCSSCDGRIPLEATVCPYCASGQKSTLTPISGNTKELHHQSLQDSLTSLYSPPYAGKNSGFMNNEKKEVPNSGKPEPLSDPMAEKKFTNSSVAMGVPTIPVDSSEDHQIEGGRSSFWPILLLSIGGNLLTLGLLQLFFSDGGFLRLEWDSSYWFAYCLAALPLFFFGFKKVNSLG